MVTAREALQSFLSRQSETTQRAQKIQSEVDERQARLQQQRDISQRGINNLVSSRRTGETTRASGQKADSIENRFEAERLKQEKFLEQAQKDIESDQRDLRDSFEEYERVRDREDRLIAEFEEARSLGRPASREAQSFIESRLLEQGFSEADLRREVVVGRALPKGKQYALESPVSVGAVSTTYGAEVVVTSSGKVVSGLNVSIAPGTDISTIGRTIVGGYSSQNQSETIFLKQLYDPLGTKRPAPINPLQSTSFERPEVLQRIKQKKPQGFFESVSDVRQNISQDVANFLAKGLVPKRIIGENFQTRELTKQEFEERRLGVLQSVEIGQFFIPVVGTGLAAAELAADIETGNIQQALESSGTGAAIFIGLKIAGKGFGKSASIAEKIDELIGSKIVKTPATSTVSFIQKGTELAIPGLFAASTKTSFDERINELRSGESPQVVRQKIQLDSRSFAGTIVGFEGASKVFKAGREASLLLRGAKEIPAKDLVEPAVLSGKKLFPTTKPGDVPTLLRKFREPIGPFKDPGGFTATRSPASSFREAKPSKSETPGIFISDTPSIYFLKQKGSMLEDVRVPSFIPSLEAAAGEPLLVRFKIPVNPIPSKVLSKFKDVQGVLRKPGRGQSLQQELANIEFTKLSEKEPGIAFASPQFSLGQKPETEAIIPVGTKLKELGTKFFTKIKGEAVPIAEFEPIKSPRNIEAITGTVSAKKVNRIAVSGERALRKTSFRPIISSKIKSSSSTGLEKSSISFSKASKSSESTSSIDRQTTEDISNIIDKSRIPRGSSLIIITSDPIKVTTGSSTPPSSSSFNITGSSSMKLGSSEIIGKSNKPLVRSSSSTTNFSSKEDSEFDILKTLSRGYDVFVKKRISGKQQFVEIDPKTSSFTERDAVIFGQNAIDRGIEGSFRIRESKSPLVGLEGLEALDYKFRISKKPGSKSIPVWVELEKNRLDTKSEVRQITAARIAKQLARKHIPKKTSFFRSRRGINNYKKAGVTI